MKTEESYAKQILKRKKKSGIFLKVDQLQEIREAYTHIRLDFDWLTDAVKHRIYAL